MFWYNLPRNYFYSLLFFISYHHVSSQVDTSKAFLISSSYIDLRNSNCENIIAKDSLLDELQNYMQRSTLGNIGLPSFTFEPSYSYYQDQDLGFRLKPLVYNNILSTSDKIFLETKKNFCRTMTIKKYHRQRAHANPFSDHDLIVLIFFKFILDPKIHHTLTLCHIIPS